MAVRIRMTRMGRKDHPFYRIGAYDSRTPRDGRAIESLGWYDPFKEKPEEQLRVNIERVEYWISVGAQPTLKTKPLLKKAGITLHKPKKSKKQDKKADTKKGGKAKKSKKK